jgi:hypothetical protein
MQPSSGSSNRRSVLGAGEATFLSDSQGVAGQSGDLWRGYRGRASIPGLARLQLKCRSEKKKLTNPH